MGEDSTIPILYDETYRKKQFWNSQVNSMGNSPNCLGYLEHHASTTDGSFAICVAAGSATLVRKVCEERRHLLMDIFSPDRSRSKKFYETIPEQHRPSLDTEVAGEEVKFAPFDTTSKALGSIIMPVILTDTITGNRFCIKLYALVLEDLYMDMFIGQSHSIFSSIRSGQGTVTYNLELGNGNKAQVVYRL
jgi:hypothetical protein